MFTSLQRSFAREEIKKVPNSLQSAHLMEMDHSLVQRYASDRHKILDFILRSNLIKEIRSPNGTVDDVSDIDLHSISADYVIDCVKSGGVVDILEATKKYYDESTHPLPVMIHSQAGNSYFLLCDLDLSGSPPRRIPPSIDLKPNNTSSLPDHLTSENNVPFRADYSFKDTVEAVIPLKLAEDVEVLSLGLESLKSGLSDDNLRESAYEIFLASMVFSGIDIHPNDYRRKEKSSKFLSGLKSKQDTDKVKSEHLLRERHLELIATVRIQMQISEAMDVCIRQRLMQFAPRNICGQIDVPQVSIGLLKGMLKSDFLNEKSYMQWRNRQANILEELFCSSAFMTSECSTIGSALAKIRNSNEWDFIMTPTERAEVVLAIRQIALKLSSMPGKFGMKGETYHWTAGYNLNIRLYERLLFGVFDILEESQLIAEAKDILMLIEMTWDTLGITQKMHDALFGWVLFQQFVVTDEAMLLEHAILQVEKVLSAEDNDGKERLYMDSLVCSRICNGIELKLSLVQAILFSMSIWCDNKLQDYHLHFSQEPCNFKRVMTLASALRVVASDECSDSKSLQSSVVKGIAARNVEVFVEKSTEAAYRRAADIVDLESKAKRIHPLALLANELKLIAKKEFTVFSPVLCHWCREARLISAKLLHQLYGDRLKPFLMGASSLSEDVRSVFPAADMLECELTAVYNSACKDIRLHQALDQDLDHYQIGEISRSLILDWVIAQNTHILEWTRRVFDLEEWEPLSSRQRQAASTIEVFRIFEETVDQLFGLDLPMDITHLQALLSIIFHSLDSYVREIVNQLVEKNHLIPSSPALTRYKKAVIPLMKKKLVRSNLLDDKVNEKLNMLTIPKLCVRLSTLHYIIKQLDAVEDSIRKSWALVKPSISRIWTKEESPEILEMNFSMGCESVDALFDTTFNSIRNTATDVIIKICDFTGARVVFWDMRESFLFRLYHGNVEDARLDSILPHVDTVLHLVCSLIDDTLRDRVVLSIYRSLLEGFVWLYLDGGPSRAFSDSDIIMMEDDLNMLKVFFVADGEGLPQLLVEQEAKTAEHILSLFSLQTETLIQMLMTASKDISTVIYSSKHGSVCMDDCHTLVRVLCHKKDGEASKFLKMQYQLPTSSEYDDTPLKEPTLRSPLISDLMKHSASFHWSDKGQSSFRSMKKKLQEATSEIRHAW